MLLNSTFPAEFRAVGDVISSLNDSGERKNESEMQFECCFDLTIYSGKIPALIIRTAGIESRNL